MVLPVPKPTAQPDLQAAGRRTTMHNRSILLVEDNPDDVVLTMRALQKNGLDHAVVVVRDGVEALDYLQGRGRYAGRDTSQSPALVLLDLKLPRLGGLELLEQIKGDRVLHQLRVVVLTSSQEEEDVLTSYSHGASSYIRKPVDFNEFQKAVGQLGQYWLRLNEATPT
jgi:two-component system, response regulator